MEHALVSADMLVTGNLNMDTNTIGINTFKVTNKQYVDARLGKDNVGVILSLTSSNGKMTGFNATASYEFSSLRKLISPLLYSIILPMVSTSGSRSGSITMHSSQYHETTVLDKKMMINLWIIKPKPHTKSKTEAEKVINDLPKFDYAAYGKVAINYLSVE
ncbi:hypothetical protein CHS0354_034644 [Potamilus streckersoni]|uniref:Uncharacterized protein n=1 Tax=Potamilus streckersoni TaxID=2493646 RepID=A0AAE0TBX3_9BIVA|nr:hypothetical protein CHS0354_034644 [Potamilus streckersoni]